MRKNLADRVTALEVTITATKPRWRTVTTETVYADDDDKAEARKRAAAIAADRKANPEWEGDYIVLIPVSTYSEAGEWLGPKWMRKKESSP